jgi:hypothetical protein
MKFNPYAALLMTGALMILTVVMSQTGSNATLLRAGVASVDRDLSSFAARTWLSLEGGRARDEQVPASPTRVAALDSQPQPNGAAAN